jgi:hypothetical protein
MTFINISRNLSSLANLKLKQVYDRNIYIYIKERKVNNVNINKYDIQQDELVLIIHYFHIFSDQESDYKIPQT